MFKGLHRFSIAVVTALVALSLVAGCSTKPAPKDEPKTTPPAAAKAVEKEAPALAALVKEGKLPKLEERLPKEPLVVKAEKVGVYGGNWRMGLRGRSDTAVYTRIIAYEYLVRFDPEWKSVIPNLATKWEMSADAKSWTFTLREGVKWSDGKPFTADDIVFFMEQVAASKDIYPVPPGWLVVGGKLPKVTKVDNYKVKFDFDQPYGMFLQTAAQVDKWVHAPAHYLKQWLNTPENKQRIDDEIKKLGLKDFKALWELKSSAWDNPELPTVHAWVVKVPLGAGTKVSFERNPYYWKVDTEGKQLPYIDTVSNDIFEDTNAIVLKALNGEIDMQDRHINTLQNKSIFFDGQAKGNFRIYDWVSTPSNTMGIHLNLTHENLELRKVFGDKNFRIALSHAIDRKKIIDTIFVSQGEPNQVAPVKGSVYYDEQFAKQYTEFDVAKANQMLDQILPKKDSAGFRLLPSGKRLQVNLEIANGVQAYFVDVAEMVKKNWAAVGVEMLVKPEDRTLFYDRKKANQHDAGVWVGSGGLDVVQSPRNYYPDSDEAIYGTAWYYWLNSGGKQGVEPPADVKKQHDLIQQMKATGDAAKQEQFMREVLKIAKDNFWVIGIGTPVKGFGIVKNDMQNVPKAMTDAWVFPSPGPYNPAAFFFKK